MPIGQRRDEPSLASPVITNNADLSHRGARRFPRAGGWFGRLPVGVPISKYRPVAIHFMCIGQCSAPAHFNTLLTDHRLAKFQSLDRRLRLGARVPRMPMCHVFCAGLVGTARSLIKIRCQHRFIPSSLNNDLFDPRARVQRFHTACFGHEPVPCVGDCVDNRFVVIEKAVR